MASNETVMGKSRFQAFSDGVVAIIITIMVLEIKVPHGETSEASIPLFPVFLSYVLSFIYLGVYWNNHHHIALIWLVPDRRIEHVLAPAQRCLSR